MFPYSLRPRILNRSIVFPLLLRIFLSSTQAQQSTSITFQHVPIEQGLPTSTITAILQDAQGFLWFGTPQGVARYDGYEYMVPKDTSSPGGEYVYVLFQDTSGNIWIGTVGEGLKKFDPVHESIVQHKHDPANPASLSSNLVYSAFQDHSGRLWFGSLGGLDQFDPANQRFLHMYPDTAAESVTYQVTGICERSSQPGVLWIGTLGGGLVRFDCVRKIAKHYVHDPGTPNSLSNNSVRFVCELPGFPTVLWIGTEGGGLNRFDVERERFTSFKNNPKDPASLSHNSTRAMMRDRSGVVWLGTSGGGLDRFDPVTETFARYQNNPEDTRTLANDNVNVLCEDPSGIHWIGTRGGLDRFGPERERIVLYQHHPGDPHSLSCNFVYSMCEDRTHILWIATWGGGLNRFDPTTGTFAAHVHSTHDPFSLRNDYVRAVYEDRSGILWVGNSEGILHEFDRSRTKFKAFKFLNNSKNEKANDILSILEDSDGTLWVGTVEGLNTLDRKTGTCTPVTVGPLVPNAPRLGYVYSLYEDKNGALWIGTRYEGLIEYQKRTGAVVVYKHSPSNHRSLSRDWVYYTHEDRQGALWVATNGGGLNRFDRDTKEFTSFTTADGLPNNNVYGFLPDDSGNLWMSTDNGLCRFNPATHLCKNFDMKDGLQAREFDFHSFCRSSTGAFFFGGLNGLNAFHPDSIQDNVHIPTVIITTIKSFDRDLQTDKVFPYLQEIILSHEENYLSFEFAALDFKDPVKNLYAYRLEGLDKEWIHSRTRRYATYSNLDPGRYVFRVRGSNNDGVWNEQGTSITLVIIPPFWATWWFRGLALITIFLAIGGAIRYFEMRRLNRRIELLEQERALERERSRISQDMHDEVGAGLTEIGILSELAKRNIQNPQEAEAHMQRVSETSREAIASIGEIIWAINPKNDLLDDLVAFLRQFTARYLRPTGMTVNFETPESLPNFHLTSESRRNIFLVIKESLHNIVKHSEATAVSVTISFTQEQLDIVVRDNGKGFSTSDTSRFGNGLHNMEKRMKSIGGECVVKSNPGEGTCVAIGLDLEAGA